MRRGRRRRPGKGMYEGQDDSLFWLLAFLGLVILVVAWAFQQWWLWALAILTGLLAVVRGGLRVWKNRSR